MKLRKTILALLCLSAINAYAKDPNVKAYCSDVYKESPPGWVNVESMHGVTIINKSKTAITYDVYFDNAIQYPKTREIPLDYTNPPYVPNAHQEHHFYVQPGQTLNFGEVKIGKLAGFPRKGRYPTESITTVIFNGILLDQCIHYNNVFII